VGFLRTHRRRRKRKPAAASTAAVAIFTTPTTPIIPIIPIIPITPIAAAAIAAAADIPAIRAALAAWFRAHQRRMPWRDQPSLYNTVVSEFMLQQTRVDTARPYFERWVARWPRFAALAAASEADAVKAWEGLGYYTRARNLRKLAIALAAMPAPPRTAKDWEALPGVGPYTAAAIASIAQGEAVAVVDGNVVRVLSRLAADSREFKDNGAAVKAFAAGAQALLDPAAPGQHNQAMMELGALVCLPRAPLCAGCPVSKFCAAARGGTPEDFPRLAPRRVEKLEVHRLWVVHEGRLLLQRHAAGAKRLSGLHEFPDARLFPEINDARLFPEIDLTAAPLARRKRAISNQQITETLHRLAATPALLRAIERTPGLRWVPLTTTALNALTLSGPHRKWLATLPRE
jgi:A/G-specific adenine glycosylase